MYRLLVVCEGPTDLALLEAAFGCRLDDYVVTVLQPERSTLQSLGPHGGGWKGVRAWCEQVREQGGLGHLLTQGDVLVLHADADIADDPEVGCRKPCPPASDTTDAVRGVIRGWLGANRIPDRVVLCVPSKATEAWVFVALFPDDPKVAGIECRDAPESLLVGRHPRLVRRKGSEYRKDRRTYESLKDRFRERWQDVTERCSEAARYDADVAAVVPGS
ncbi:hypothetical protein KBD49_03720 [Myxococcota bacterium]|jgi:hypothetical protein|nr:hypothetical protein [Myxococcota bacterium]